MIDGGLEAQYKHNVFIVWCECSVSGLGLVLRAGVVERLVGWVGELGGACLLCLGRGLVMGGWARVGVGGASSGRGPSQWLVGGVVGGWEVVAGGVGGSGLGGWAGGGGGRG